MDAQRGAGRRPRASRLVRFLCERLRRTARDSMSRNAIFLMASTGVMALLGFVFWLFVAKLYQTSDVGVAYAVISMSVLIGNLSMLGLNVALIRFLPDSPTPSGDTNAAMIIVGGVAVVASAVYALAGPGLRARLPFFTGSPLRVLLFSLMLAVIAVNTLTDSVFIAARKAQYHTIGYTVFGLVRLALAFLLVRAGSLGIFLAYIAAGIITLLLSLYYMRRACGYRFLSRPTFDVLLRTRRFTGHNYVAQLLASAPAHLVPTLIVVRLGGTDAAFFAMAIAIVGILQIVSVAVGASLLAEGANDASRGMKDVRRAVGLLGAFMVPVAAVMIAAAPYLLRIFAEQYADGGSGLLRLLALSTAILSVADIGTSLLNVQQRTLWGGAINLVLAVTVVGGAWLLMPLGLTGVGTAFVAGATVTAVLHLVVQLVPGRRDGDRRRPARPEPLPGEPQVVGRSS